VRYGHDMEGERGEELEWEVGGWRREGGDDTFVLFQQSSF